jgi:hypothetical protein
MGKPWPLASAFPIVEGTMSTTRVTTRRGRAVGDYFEPDEASDPHHQRQLRGQLEEIDYAAYDANRKIIGGAIDKIDVQQFQRLGLAAAQARARWIATALATTEQARTPTPDQIDELRNLRLTFEELTEAYDGMRRMVERGYLAYATPRAPKA